MAVGLVMFVAIGVSSMSQTFDKNISVGDTVTFGKENREWIVLDKEDGKALLLTKESVGEKAYNDERVDITWEECTLRKWLNEDFYNDSFNKAQKSRICETTVKNEDNTEYNTGGGNNTTDKIFLLSIDEAEKYFEIRDIGSWWWLRSPGVGSDFAAGVESDNDIYYYGISVNYRYSVRPALWVNLES